MTSRDLINNSWYAHPDVSDEGTVRFAWNRIKPLVCVRRYGSSEWIELDQLSASLWMRYRRVICNSIPRPSEKQGDTINLIKSLVSTLSSEQKAKWLKNNPEYKDNICRSCGCFESEIKKCIQRDCSGMCAGCFDVKNKIGFEKCACCGEKQEMTCPCCQEDFALENMVKSEQCDHRICWGCFGRSVKTSRPISHCPMCRGIFCEKLVEHDDSDSSEDEFVDDDAITADFGIVRDDDDDDLFSIAEAQASRLSEMDWNEIVSAIDDGLLILHNPQGINV